MTFYHDAEKGKYYEWMARNWILKRGIHEKYVIYVGNREKDHDFILARGSLIRNNIKYNKIESKTLGYHKDYLFLETYSRYEYKDPGWAFGIKNNKLHTRIKKDVLYTFANKTNKKIVVIGGYDLCKIGKFLHINNKKIKIECGRCHSKFLLPEIRINGLLLKQTIQHTHEHGYHSAQFQIPLKDIEGFIGKKAISIYKGEYLLK